MHLPLLLVGVGAVLLAFFGQSFLSDFALVLPPLGQVLQQLRLMTLEGDRGEDVFLVLLFPTESFSCQFVFTVSL